MNEAKIQFSDSELELMQNANIILMKNGVLKKVKTLLEDLQEQMVQYVPAERANLRPAYFETPPKISRGEQYLGLPYLVLDYPRLFRFTGIFAVRTMFWWGHYYSSTLHLSGEYKEKFIRRLEEAYSELSTRNYFISNNQDQWQHSFQGENYLAIASISLSEFKDLCRQYDHIKIACSFPLDAVEQVQHQLFESWRFLLGLCTV